MRKYKLDGTTKKREFWIRNGNISPRKRAETRLLLT
jgi:hypothetical protein